MDSPATSLDFAVIGHQDSWQNISSFINDIRSNQPGKLPVEKIKDIFSFIPPRDLFKIKVRSTTGDEVNGAYIETFIDPDKLDAAFIRANIGKVMSAMSFAKKMGAKIVALGGFTSIVLEGNLGSLSLDGTKFTTGNTLTAAFIVKAIEKAALQQARDLQHSTILIIGATGDIGMACANFLKSRTKELLLNARNQQRLEKAARRLSKEGIRVRYSSCLQELVPEADVIISAASSSGIQLEGCKKNVLICDAGYPKNLDAKIETNGVLRSFHGGMGQVSEGFAFHPDYSNAVYHYAAPYVSHGCILEAIVLAFEKRFENYSVGKGNISADKMEEIYALSVKHGIDVAPFYNARGLWQKDQRS
jgi:fatty aldehyde-generating acyl-ACP reductase